MSTLALPQNRAILSSKGQVVIPKLLRTLLGLHAGSELVFEVQGDHTLVVKPTQRKIEMLFNLCQKTPAPAVSTNAMDSAIGEAILALDDASRAK